MALSLVNITMCDLVHVCMFGCMGLQCMHGAVCCMRTNMSVRFVCKSMCFELDRFPVL